MGQQITRPTTDVDGGALSIGCTGQNVGSGAQLVNARDAAGQATSSVISGFGTLTQSRYKTRVFLGWQNTTNVYATLVLHVNASSGGNVGDAGANSCIVYSIDGGAHYTTLGCTDEAYSQQNFDAILSAAQDQTKLRVGVCVSGIKGNSQTQTLPGGINLTLYDVWLSSTTAAQPAGPGSTAGQAHRGAAVSN